LFPELWGVLSKKYPCSFQYLVAFSLNFHLVISEFEVIHIDLLHFAFILLLARDKSSFFLLQVSLFKRRCGEQRWKNSELFKAAIVTLLAKGDCVQ
jgi:hypothetical protein